MAGFVLASFNSLQLLTIWRVLNGENTPQVCARTHRIEPDYVIARQGRNMALCWTLTEGALNFRPNSDSCGTFKQELMKRRRIQVTYSGNVQGVGFRYTVKNVATGFEVTGTVRNLPNGRVELIAEGTSGELTAFREAICDAGLQHFISNEDISWGEAVSQFRGFEIVK
jgi:acylphosphatase